MSGLLVRTADSRVLVARSRRLCHELRPLFARSAALKARAAELCTIARRIGGGSDGDIPIIVEIIAASSVCLGCLAEKAATSAAPTRDVMERIRAIMAVSVESGRCEACLQVTTVYRLAKPKSSATSPHGPVASAPPMTQQEAIWQFLAGRRGEMFCTQCIANALLATKRIDRAILGAEGRGAKRLYGPCASCGKERLLCGLAR